MEASPSATIKFEEGPGDEPAAELQTARAIVAEINRFRRDPKKYVDHMARLQDCFQDRMLSFPDGGLEIETIEGISALLDCLQDLRGAAPLPELMLSPAISSACEKHLADLQANDFCSHIGTDGSTPEARLARVGEHREQCGENALFGARTAEETVYLMLLDDGSPERGHRANLMNADFRFVGAAHGRHPSAETVTVLLLADHFRVKQVHHAEHVRRVAEAGLGAAVLDQDGESPDATTYKAWGTLMEELKPDHLKVPQSLTDQVQRMDRPKLYRAKRAAVPHFAVGSLQPKRNVDPAVLRAFVHRVDLNRDDRFEEPELIAVCHQHQLSFSPEDITRMFNEVLERRQPGEWDLRAVDWAELFGAVRVQKRFVPVVDVHVEQGAGERHQLTMETEALTAWCREVYAEYGEQCNLEPPPGGAAASASGATTGLEDANKTMKPLPRNGQGAAQLGQLNKYLASVLSATIARTGKPLQEEPKVTKFFRRPNGLGPLTAFESAVCMSQRRLWAHKTRRHREDWLPFIYAVGLDPLVPLPEVTKKKPIEGHIQQAISQVDKKNVARPEKVHYSGLPPGVEKMQVQDPPERLHVLPKQATRTIPQRSLRSTNTAHVKPWEEKQMQTETLVNACILTDAARGATAGPGAPEMAYSFDARRKFLQVLQKEERASDEQTFLASKRNKEMSLSSSMGLRGGRGVGAHSASAPGGVRGHFHNTSTIHAKDGSHGFPQSLEVRWDGEHLDHTKAPPLRPNAKLSTMPREERDRQFSTYFEKPDNFHLKASTAVFHRPDVDSYQGFRSHEFRADNPSRHGKYGRRAFDPQVREKPVTNQHGLSEIENKPQEDFLREQEQVHEFLDRCLPPKQKQHFMQYQPQDQMPKRHEEMASREVVRFVMDGDQKRHAHGFGQNRHSCGDDMQLYSRPLGATHMDRLVPMA